MKQQSPLDTIQIATPCPARWEDMDGDERVRYCNQCSLQVYDLSAMSRTEAESLIEEREGRLCARLYRRDDGKVITADCPGGVRAAARWAAVKVLALTGLILALGLTAVGLTKRRPGGGYSASGTLERWTSYEPLKSIAEFCGWRDSPQAFYTLGVVCPLPTNSTDGGTPPSAGGDRDSGEDGE